jgi:hypothetical protein
VFFPVFPVLTPRERGAIDWRVAHLWRQEPFVRVLGVETGWRKVEIEVETGGD